MRKCPWLLALICALAFASPAWAEQGAAPEFLKDDLGFPTLQTLPNQDAGDDSPVRIDVDPGYIELEVGSHSVSLASEDSAGPFAPTTAFERGLTTAHPLGTETIVTDENGAEQFFSVQSRQGFRRWSWQLDTTLEPRIDEEGGIVFLKPDTGQGDQLSELYIAPAKIYDAEGNDVTPFGLRWNLAASDSTISLSFDDSSLPLPYVIDPSIVYRGSTANSNGAGSTSLTITRPVGVVAYDLMIAQVGSRGGTGLTITAPAGWTLIRRDNSTTVLAQASYYKVASAAEPTTYTWSFSGTFKAAGGIAAYSGTRTSGAIQAQAGQTNASSTTVTAPSVTTTSANSHIVSLYSSATGTGSSGTNWAGITTERWDVSATSNSSATRVSAAAGDKIQVDIGATGSSVATASATAVSIGQTIAIRPDDVLPTALVTTPEAEARVGGQVVVAATVSDADSGVASVELQFSPAGQGSWSTGPTDTQAPYAITWETGSLAHGPYDIRVLATDGAGNTAHSPMVTVDVTPPAPTSLASIPTSPADDNSPFITGTAVSGSAVRLYSAADCTGAPVAAGTAEEFASPGFQVTASDDSTTTFTASAVVDEVESACSSLYTYVEDSTAPGAPTVLVTSPASPANENNPKVKGSAEASGTVSVYASSDCSSSPIASGSSASFSNPGLTVSVTDNSSTVFSATVTDQAGHISPCSATPYIYVEDSDAPEPPIVSSVTPASPANNNLPVVSGTVSEGTIVRIYKTADCSGLAAASGTTAAFASPGITVSVTDNTTSTLKATVSDAAGNTSLCSTSSVTYTEDSSAPAAPTALVLTPQGPANNNSPILTGDIEAFSTVNVYTTTDCSGTPIATGSASSFYFPGLSLSVADNTTTTFKTKATDAAGNSSTCSAPVSYIEDSSYPQRRGVTIAGPRLILTFNESLDPSSPPSAADLTVLVNGTERATSSGLVASRRAELQLSSPVEPTDVVLVTYAAPASGGIRDLALNKATSFSSAKAINNSAPYPAELVADNPLGLYRLDDDQYYKAHASKMISNNSQSGMGYQTSVYYSGSRGNSIQIEQKAQGNNTPLSILVEDLQVTVNLATSATGAVTSTTNQVIAAVASHPEASYLVVAKTYYSGGGGGWGSGSGTGVAPTQALTYLSGGNNNVRLGDHRDYAPLKESSGNAHTGRSWDQTGFEYERLVYTPPEGTPEVSDRSASMGLPTPSPPYADGLTAFHYPGAEVPLYTGPSDPANPTARLNHLSPWTFTALSQPAAVVDKWQSLAGHATYTAGSYVGGMALQINPALGKARVYINIPWYTFTTTRSYEATIDGYYANKPSLIHFVYLGGGVLRIYWNGALVQEFTGVDLSTYIGTNSNATAKWGIGAAGAGYFNVNGGNSSPWAGGMDEAAFYDHALSAGRVDAHASVGVYNGPPLAEAPGPAITGTPKVDQALSVSKGSWYGRPPYAYSYQWQRCDRDEAAELVCSDITGATSSSYTLTDDDLQKEIRARVTNTNPWGSTSATSSVTSSIGPRPEQVRGSCGDSPHSKPSAACASDPVNTYTGAFVSEHTDVALPGKGLPFSFVRTYDSSNTASGRLGKGWVGGYEANLTIQNAGARVAFNAEDGQQLVYLRQVDGSYKTPGGALSSLAKLASGDYELTRIDQVRYVFHPVSSGTVGRLESIRDRNELGLTFGYGTDGLMTQITDSSGRLIDLTRENGRITRITLPDSRYVEYTYTNGLLTAVRDLRGKITSYQYGAGDRLVKEITEVNGAQKTVLENIYDATSGRVIEQIDALGIHTYIAWNATTQTATVTDAAGKAWQDVYVNGVLKQRIDPLGNTTRYTHDSKLNVVAVTDPRGNKTAMEYDARGNLTARIYPRLAPEHEPLEEEFTYNALNDVLTAKDQNGNVTAFEYDAKGNLVKETRPDGTAEGATLTYTRDAATGQVTKAVPPRGHVSGANPDDFDTLYDYNAAGDLESIETPTGRVTTMTYDLTGRMLSVTSPKGNIAGTTAEDFTTHFTYDGLNNILTKTDPLDRVTAHTYDALGNLKTIVLAQGTSDEQTVSYDYSDAHEKINETAPGGALTKWEYDNRGHVSALLVQTSLNAGGLPVFSKTTYTYDDAGRLKTKVDPRGNVDGCACAAQYTWTYNYDQNGNLTETLDPKGGLTKYTYDALNRLKTTAVKTGVDGNGQPIFSTTTFAYDGVGRLLSEQDPLGHSTSQTYDPLGRVLTESDARGKVTTFEYDKSSNRIEAKSPLGNTTTYSYNADDQMTSLVDPLGNKPGGDPFAHDTLYAYDANGNLETVTDPLGNPTVYSYDRVGNRLSVQDPALRVTGYEYDALDRLKKVTAPGGAETIYAYDAAGNLQSRTGANLHVTSYEYDLARQLTAIVAPGSRRWSYSYDAAGNRTQAVDANGNATAGDQSDGITTAVYDAVGLRTATDYSDPATPDVVYQYDLAGRLTQMTDNALGVGSAESYSYDALGQPLEITRGADVLAYEYDQSGNITKRAHPGGAGRPAVVSDYAYDDDGRLASVTSDSQTVNYTYDESSQMTKAVLPNGVEERRTYDANGRVTLLENVKPQDPAPDVTISRFAYSYDAVGNPTEKAGLVDLERYSYDVRDQLTGVCYTAACDAAATPAIKYTYDAVGNRLTDRRLSDTGDTVYSYDEFDQLTQKTPALGAATTYAYDQNGNQIQAGDRHFAFNQANLVSSVCQGGPCGGTGTPLVSYSYDGAGKRLLEARGAQEARYLWDTSFGVPQIVLERDQDDELVRRYTYGHQRLSLTDTSQTSYYSYDAIGSTVGISSSTGAEQWSYSYDPFGEEKTALQPDLGAPANPMRFAGEMLDVDTELYHLRARQYDPSNGRFLSTDPLSPEIDDPYVSTYIYVNNRPLVLVDPLGLRGGTPWGSVGGWFSDRADDASRGVSWLDDNILQPYVETVDSAGLSVIAAVQDPSLLLENPLPGLVESASGCFGGGSNAKQRTVGCTSVGLALLTRKGKAGKKEGGTDATGRPLSSPNYSVGFEAKLSAGSDFPGKSRGYHNQKANSQLHQAFKDDPEYAAAMEKIAPGIVQHMKPGSRGKHKRSAPKDWTWHHHPTRPGVMQLVPYAQHIALGPVQGSLHPGKAGGQNNWGGGVK